MPIESKPINKQEVINLLSSNTELLREKLPQDYKNKEDLVHDILTTPLNIALNDYTLWSQAVDNFEDNLFILLEHNLVDQTRLDDYAKMMTDKLKGKEIQDVIMNTKYDLDIYKEDMRRIAQEMKKVIDNPSKKELEQLQEELEQFRAIGKAVADLEKAENGIVAPTTNLNSLDNSNSYSGSESYNDKEGLVALLAGIVNDESPSMSVLEQKGSINAGLNSNIASNINPGLKKKPSNSCSPNGGTPVSSQNNPVR